jgi:hypothetical protein
MGDVMRKRAAVEQGFEAGLVALRAQGLEPSDVAKRLAERVCAGRMTLKEMAQILVARHSRSRRSET